MRGVELLVTHRLERVGLAVCLKSQVPPVLTPSLVHEVRHLQNIIAEQFYKDPWENIFYIVWYLCAGSIPWTGLDFNYIHNKLMSHSDKDLRNYINEVFDLLFLNYVGLGFPLINCSIVTRPLKGMSKEFFWLNQINFLKAYRNSEKNLQLSSAKKAGCFPEDIYQRNQFYDFSNLNFDAMKKVIYSTPYKSIDNDEIAKIQAVFETIKKTTLVEIYSLASKNPYLFDRMSRIQLAEHKRNHYKNVA